MSKKILSAIVVLFVCFFVIQDLAYAFIGIGLATKRVMKTVEGSGETDNSQSIKNDMQIFYDNIAKAFDKKDIDGIASSATQEALLEYINGNKVSISEWKINAKKEFADIKDMRSSFKVESAQLYGDIVNVTYTETHDYTLISDAGHQYKSIGQWQANLIKTSNGWRITSFRENAEKITRDNELFTPKPTTPRF